MSQTTIGSSRPLTPTHVFLPSSQRAWQDLLRLVDCRSLLFNQPLRHRVFLFILLSEVIRLMAIFAVVSHIMPYLNVMHVPRTTAGLIAGGISIFSIPGRLCFGWLADRFDKRRVAAVTGGMMTIGMFLLCYVYHAWVMILFLVLFPVGYGGSITLRGAMLQSYFGREAFSRLIGLVMGAASIGGIIGPTLAGYVFDTTGSYTATWIFLGITTSFTVPMMLMLEPERPKDKGGVQF